MRESSSLVSAASFYLCVSLSACYVEGDPERTSSKNFVYPIKKGEGERKCTVRSHKTFGLQN